ncbi:MAG: DUF2007 domain-containing protein [Chloroflexota bacterium]|nr:DUF2007 domain-containing protein [Dehalococcoidia bacterium]MDW8252623.1 DUF2007 domain-containing protein [Chloroflexota bacterium]
MEGWEHVITAPDQTIGEMLKAMLEEEGVVAMLEPEDAVSFLGVSAIPVRLMVPVEQAPVARQLLQEFQEAEADWQRDDDDDRAGEEPDD